VALRIYGLLLVVIAVMRVVIWLYATNRPHLLWRRLDDHQRRAGLAVGLFPGLVYLLAFLVARAAPGVSLLIYAAHAGAVLPQHHGPAQRPESGPGVRGLHLASR
jgi:uncharacterized membrane protein SpoIIM required for sporulation